MLEERDAFRQVGFLTIDKTTYSVFVSDTMQDLVVDIDDTGILLAEGFDTETAENAPSLEEFENYMVDLQSGENKEYGHALGGMCHDVTGYIQHSDSSITVFLYCGGDSYVMMRIGLNGIITPAQELSFNVEIEPDDYD